MRKLAALFLFLIPAIAGAGGPSSSRKPSDLAIPREDTECDAAHAAEANAAVSAALVNLRAPRCQSVLDDKWAKALKRRLESKTLLICRTDENRGVSPHSTAYYQSPYIHLRKGFFEQEAVGQAATMFHEASHAVGAPAPLDHDRKTDPLLSFRMQGGLAAFRWVRDPVYFCSWYCNYDDEGVKDAALTRILGLRLTLEHYSKTAEGRARLAVLDSLKAEIETFDYRAHAKKICHFDAAFPRDWFVPLPPL